MAAEVRCKMALIRCAIHETRSVADPPASVSVQDQVGAFGGCLVDFTCVGIVVSAVLGDQSVEARGVNGWMGHRGASVLGALCGQGGWSGTSRGRSEGGAGSSGGLGACELGREALGSVQFLVQFAHVEIQGADGGFKEGE